MHSLLRITTGLGAAGTAEHVATWVISLLVLAAAIGIRVAWAGRRGNSDVRTLLRRTVPAAWVVPALAIVIAVATQASPMLSPRQAPVDIPGPTRHNALPTVKGHSWTSQSLVEQDDSGRTIVRTPIASKPHSTAKMARQEALQLAALRLKYEVERVYGRAGDWDLSGESLDQQRFITNEITTTRPYKLSSLAPSSDMYHCVVRLEISDASRNWAAGYWKRSVGAGRLKTIGTITALLCLLIVTAHLYLRLDIASRGTHRGKLQLAAVAAVAAAGLVASTVLSA
jgi:hypothetical protein